MYKITAHTKKVLITGKSNGSLSITLTRKLIDDANLKIGDRFSAEIDGDTLRLRQDDAGIYNLNVNTYVSMSARKLDTLLTDRPSAQRVSYRIEGDELCIDISDFLYVPTGFGVLEREVNEPNDFEKGFAHVL